MRTEGGLGLLDDGGVDRVVVLELGSKSSVERYIVKIDSWECPLINDAGQGETREP